MKTHFLSLFAPENRMKTIILLLSATVLVTISLVVGIEDNPIGLLLLIGGLLCFFHSLVHIWNKPRKFAILALTAVGTIILTFLIVMIIYSIDKSYNEFLSGLAIYIIFMICLPCIIIGVFGYLTTPKPEEVK